MELSRRFEGKKFMWDGRTHTDEAEACNAAQQYAADGFQTQIVAEDGYFVFTRREVKQAASQGEV